MAFDPAQSSTKASPPPFTIKGGMISVTLFELYEDNPEQFALHLEQQIASMPSLFEGTPVVLSLEKLEDGGEHLDLATYLAICRKLGTVPVGIRGGIRQAAERARQEGVSALPPSGKKSADPGRASDTNDKTSDIPTLDNRVEPAQNENTPDAPEPAPAPVESSGTEAYQPTRIIRQPVRSGQQVYASGGDLIVLAQVSAGAEILADGNIHVYGPLRGRALAGIKGDTSARIFCQSLEAELVSVAGQYKISEDLQKEGWKQARQIYLDQEKLVIAPLAD